ncbi:MAG TPA: hypothetical protein DDY43_12010 [Synechococcales bacterium UBA10510]|nr:hypothetical protein [Synechococcales bacterium UBA10510]
MSHGPPRHHQRQRVLCRCHYISDSLDRLFQMIWEGHPKRDDATAQLPLADPGGEYHDSFRLTPLMAHLID